MSESYVRCRGCGEDLTADSEKAVRIQTGQVDGTEDGFVDFEEDLQNSEWGYMHLKCFLLAVGDPEGIEMLMSQQGQPHRSQPHATGVEGGSV